MYASETRRLIKLEEKLIITWERKILRRIFGPKKAYVAWKIRTNKELTEVYNPGIVAEIRSRRIAWLGHLIRIDRDRWLSNHLMESWEEEGGRQADPD
jgi:hypothetical protein